MSDSVGFQFDSALQDMLAFDPLDKLNCTDEQIPAGAASAALEARSTAITQHIQGITSKFAAIEPSSSAMQQACRTALCSSCIGYPSDLPAVRVLVKAAGSDYNSSEILAALNDMLCRGWCGACAWHLLLSCDLQVLEQCVAETHLLWSKWHEGRSLLMWPSKAALCRPNCIIRRDYKPRRALMLPRRYTHERLHPHSLHCRELVGSLALVLCATEPTCRALATSAGLLGCSGGAGQNQQAAATAATPRSALAAAAGNCSWGLLRWDAGSDQDWSGCDLPKAVHLEGEKVHLNSIALQAVTGAQLAAGIALALKPKGMSEVAAHAKHCADKAADQQYGAAWDDWGGDDSFEYLNCAIMLSKQRDVDAAATAPWCDESHVGAALLCVAAALVQLHGEQALEALLCPASSQVDEEHAQRVLWLLEEILGQDSMPVLGPTLKAKIGLEPHKQGASPADRSSPSASKSQRRRRGKKGTKSPR